MNSNSSKRFPNSAEAWRRETTSRKLSGKSIFDLEVYDSASKLKYNQYLLLRALFIPFSRENLIVERRSDVFPMYEKAKALLGSNATDTGWQEYVDSLHPSNPPEPIVGFAKLRSFSLVRYYQTALARLDEQQQSTKTRYVTRSQSKSAGATFEQADFMTPVRPSQKLFPSEDQEVEHRLAAFGLDAPGSARSYLSPYSASDAAASAQLLAPTEDEQIVNTTLILFLTAITIHFTDKVHWSLQRKAFQMKAGITKMFEARVDG